MRFGITGSSPVRSSRYATHSVLTGHIKQRGEVGVHSVAPSSIKPWLRSPGASSLGSADMSSPALAQIAFAPCVLFTSIAIPNTRASTRDTLPSTSGARSPNAIDAIAPAVYGPMPGTARSSLARDGKRPRTAFAPACRLRARE